MDVGVARQQQALKLREQVLGPDHPDVAVSLNNYAELLRSQGCFSEAEPLFKVRVEQRWALAWILQRNSPGLTSWIFPTSKYGIRGCDQRSVPKVRETSQPLRAAAAAGHKLENSTASVRLCTSL